MISGIARLTILTAAITMTACTVFPTPEPPRVMELAPNADQIRFDQARQASLRVDTPLASDPLDSSRLLFKPSPYEFQALPDVRWRDSIPVVLRDHLIQAYRHSGAFTNVITDTSPASASHTLISELTAFHAENRSAGVVVVIELHTEVMSNRSRGTLCAHNHRVEVKANSIAVADLMTAFSEGARRVSERTSHWAFECLADGKNN
ncbi:MAG: ABC-type transport auxiliary lipoprotein family protein [Marinobacter sp.]